MADEAGSKSSVEGGNQSKYEVAQRMARVIITQIEKKQLGDITRSEYLLAVAQSVDALNGTPPSSSSP